ncbi:hypothetical protein [Streptomyces sp. NPDC051909]|uniref:hypothetical protein n=1 Tax=Streptomyces sp. NPDC051909 TaxID=3154944 RepID=UPI0034234922
MTGHPAPSGRLLSAGLMLLAAGIAVLALGRTGATTDTARAERPATQIGSTPAVPRTPATSTPPAGQPLAPAPTRAPAATPRSDPPAAAEPLPSGLPLSGEGPSGDPAIQRVLDASSPADLPAATARQLVDLATRIWLAETTGIGRERWPAYFTDPVLRAPYRDVRIQAAIARRGNGPGDRAVVRLVWAGTSPMGMTEDSRPAEVHLLRYDQAWEPAR